MWEQIPVDMTGTVRTQVISFGVNIVLIINSARHVSWEYIQRTKRNSL